MLEENANIERRKEAVARVVASSEPSAAERKWGGYFEACARSGRGPHQRDMWAAHFDFAKEAERIEDCCEESSLWVFTRDRLAWAVLEDEALNRIAERHPKGSICDLGAGSGYVAACLAARGLAVRAIHIDGTWDGWWARKYVETDSTPASQLPYDADAYLMLMPDCSAGEDLMFEALSRMPVGATLYARAPAECTGSPKGHAYLRLGFERVGDLPLISSFPWESGERECGVFVKRGDPSAEALFEESERERLSHPLHRLGRIFQNAPPLRGAWRYRDRLET